MKKAARHITRFEQRKRDGISKFVFYRVNEDYPNTKWTRAVIREAIREEKEIHKMMIEEMEKQFANMPPLEDIEEMKKKFVVKRRVNQG